MVIHNFPSMKAFKKGLMMSGSRQFASGLRMPYIGHPCLRKQTYANYFNLQAISSLLWIQSFRYAGRGNPCLRLPLWGTGGGGNTAYLQTGGIFPFSVIVSSLLTHRLMVFFYYQSVVYWYLGNALCIYFLFFLLFYYFSAVFLPSQVINNKLFKMRWKLNKRTNSPQ